jgi:hypothetical protein
VLIVPVILLDEADVFLEQRTLVDMERNALVSVFLRALEYYDGKILSEFLLFCIASQLTYHRNFNTHDQSRRQLRRRLHISDSIGTPLQASQSYGAF